jgi:hypothetical protein
MSTEAMGRRAYALPSPCWLAPPFTVRAQSLFTRALLLQAATLTGTYRVGKCLDLLPPHLATRAKVREFRPGGCDSRRGEAPAFMLTPSTWRECHIVLLSEASVMHYY